MKRLVFLQMFLFASILLFAQVPVNEPAKVYQATPEKINDLVHTKLDAKFDYSNSQLHGKVWITLKPHFYPTDSLELDAKGMLINEVAIVKNAKNEVLKYEYDGMILRVKLNKTYRHNEQYTIYISYTAKPDEYTGKGSAAITDAKGLYFINPRGEDPNKPTQIWTQGETEATSVWVPTIDKPNQKTTNEILMTVPAKYVTLSNGKLVSQKKNADGTRTDHWKMELPHAPYLFFMGVGDFAVVKDSYKGKEVSYYVEKEYAPVARKIFGTTPAMMALFSKLTGVEYPWVKYAQLVGRDYVSGAMENTTATIHQETAQQDARELTDGNRWEDVIAHELFHQWFGDYVTTESWSNISLNESFATMGSQLWNEFYYGKDKGDEERYNSIQGYMGSRSEEKELIRFHYRDKEDVFDAVSYNKGGGVLQMLRAYIGDSAFFKGINLYLTTNKFKAAEAHQLRLAFEEVTGKDLNWFFNQWYFGSGHPSLNITYKYNDASKQQQVIVEQTGNKTFTLPVKIDVWTPTGAPKQYTVWAKNKVDTFSFAAPVKPVFVNFDADKKLIAQKTENKTLEDYLFQYKNAKNYVDRREAIAAAAKKQAEVNAVQILSLALKDPYGPLRAYAINSLDLSLGQVKTAVEESLVDIAQKDRHRLAKAAAISKLGNYKLAKYATIFKPAVNDSSYTVSGFALEALSKIDSLGAVSEAQRLSAIPAKGKLASTIKKVLAGGDVASGTKLVADFEAMPMGQEKFQALQGVFELIESTSSLDVLKKAVDAIMKLQTQIPEAFRDQVNTQLNAGLKEIAGEKAKTGLKDQAEYIESKLPKDEKKGF